MNDSGSVEIVIKRANWEQLEPDSTVVFLGKRRSGKTTYAMYFSRFLEKYCGRFLVMCGTTDTLEEWVKGMPRLYVMMGNIEVLRKLIAYQSKKVACCRRQNKAIPKHVKVAVFLDDLGRNKEFMNHPVVRDLYNNGRHYGITVVSNLQYLKQLPAQNRDNIDYLGVLYVRNSKGVRDLYDEFGGSIKFKEFKSVLAKATLNRGLCWIDNIVTPVTVNDFMFFRRLAWPLSTYVVGSDLLKKYAANHTRAESNDTQ